MNIIELIKENDRQSREIFDLERRIDKYQRRVDDLKYHVEVLESVYRQSSTAKETLEHIKKAVEKKQRHRRSIRDHLAKQLWHIRKLDREFFRKEARKNAECVLDTRVELNEVEDHIDYLKTTLNILGDQS